MKDREKQITEIWLKYLEESRTNPSLTPEDYVKRYPEYARDLASLLTFTKIGQEVLKTDLTPLVNKMKDSVWSKVQRKLAENRPHFLDQKGWDSLSKGDFNSAEQAFKELLEYHQRLGNWQPLILVYHTLGMLSSTRRDLEGARGYYHLALDLCRQHNLVDLSAFCYQALGNLAFQRGSLDSARTYFTEAEKIVQLFADKETYIVNQIALADIEQICGNRVRAIMRRKKVAGLEKKGIKIKNKNLWITNYLDLAALYVSEGKKSLARKMTSEASRLLGKMPAGTKEARLKIEITSLEFIREIIAKEKQEKSILDHFKRESLFPQTPTKTEAEKETEK